MYSDPAVGHVPLATLQMSFPLRVNPREYSAGIELKLLCGHKQKDPVSPHL